MKKLVLLSFTVVLATHGCKDEEVVEAGNADRSKVASVGSHTGSDQWVRKADLGGVTRAEAVGFSIGSKGYIGTGRTGNGPNLDDFWEYDPNTDAWTQKANVGGGPRRLGTGFSAGGKGYIGTGEVGQTGNSVRVNDLWQYTAGTNTWERKANLEGQPRAAAVSFSIGSSGYIGTGNGENNVLLNDFWQYNTATDTWTRQADVGGPERELAVGFSVNNQGYIGTGASASGILQDFWEYDPATDTWTERAAHPVRRASAVGFSVLNKGYVGTGGAENAEEDFWEFNANSNEWTRVADFGGGVRTRAVGFSIGPKGYVGTGYSPPSTPEDQKDFWEYRP